MELKNIFNNEEAVSPIVATLVLVVVAIAGAAAVGGIMDNLSNDVGSDTTGATDDIATSNELLLRGSTTVQPVSEVLADAYMRDHPNMKVTVMGTGSGDGVSSTGLELCDIGAASRDLKSAEATAYPEIRTTQIGASAVVVIMHEEVNGSENKAYNISNATVLEKIYDEANTDGQVSFSDSDADNTIDVNEISSGFSASEVNLTVYDRSEASGTEDTFAKFIGGDSDYINDECTPKGAKGNAGVLAAVQADSTAIGFVDWGYANGASGIEVAGVDCDSSYITDSNLKAALNGDGEYPEDLTRPLNYLTLGNPTPEVQDFIDFALADTETSNGAFATVGYWSMNDL